MTLAERIAHLFLPPTEPQQLRTAYPAGVTIDEQVLNLRRRHTRTQAWSSVSIKEALGVPAIFGAVSLIANTVGSLSLEAYRQGVLLAQENTPRLIVRPNPFSTPRAFFRDTAFYLATRGEAWWWIAARDIDGAPLSLYPIPPWEITVAENDRNRLRPLIRWGKKEMPNDDVRQITYLPGQDGLRGVGPMQLCGAAMSVTVEAQEWAANFFSGSLPSVIGTTESDMSDDELKLMDRQWSEKEPNLPRWLTNGLTLTDSPFDAEKAQLTESRQHQVGEAARMFSMPGALIEYQMGGSSLTYQNQADIWNDFQRRCLSPHYLEPIEQEISDLLTRATVARFNLDQLLRADSKSRAEVYDKLVPLGILSVEEARRKEGYAPGAVDFAPVPLATPQATPDRLPINRTTSSVKCATCGAKLAEAMGPGTIIACRRCKTVNTAPEPGDPMLALLARAMQPVVQTPPHIEVHSAPVTVHPSSTVFEAGAFQVDAPNMRPVADAIAELEIRSEVTVEPADVTVTVPDIHVPPVTIAEGAVRVEPQITVEPTINVPEQKVNVRVTQPTPQVTVTTPDTQRVEITAMPTRVKTATRTNKGQIETMRESDG